MSAPGGFGSVAIIGVGLIGGSIAAALKQMPDAPRVVGINRGAETLEYAMDHGMIDAGALIGSPEMYEWLGPQGVDLVIVASPAHLVGSWLETLGSTGYTGVVTDVASTKSGVLAAARAALPDPTRFVGGHPMAGSERSGVQAARADLFHGAYWLLTPTHDSDPQVYTAVHAFVSALGARVISVDAEAHDEAVAIVSHVPHIAAAALVDLAAAHSGEHGELLRLAAGGFKDTTRIAAGSADLWTGICLENADAVVDGIDELRERLGVFEALLRSRDANGICEWLDGAAEVRRSLPAQWVPATAQLTEVSVPMLDRPGVVAEITSAVSRAGCNIEGIDIDHETEDTAVLVLVLTDEGNRDALVADLAARGYEPRVVPLSATAEDR
jgi:prephenate dehydrogenase